jgi:hypothetical protein
MHDLVLENASSSSEGESVFASRYFGLVMKAGNSATMQAIHREYRMLS